LLNTRSSGMPRRFSIAPTLFRGRVAGRGVS
jgi:hypothetical protein